MLPWTVMFKGSKHELAWLLIFKIDWCPWLIQRLSHSVLCSGFSYKKSKKKIWKEIWGVLIEIILRIWNTLYIQVLGFEPKFIQYLSFLWKYCEILTRRIYGVPFFTVQTFNQTGRSLVFSNIVNPYFRGYIWISWLDWLQEEP